MNDIEVTSNFTGKENSNSKSLFNFDKLEILPIQAYGIMSRHINKNMEFIDKNTVVFISGCNIVCYDLTKRTSRFLIRKSSEYLITSLAVGYKANSSDKTTEAYICVGECHPVTKISQISVISVKNPSHQFNLKFNDKINPHKNNSQSVNQASFTQQSTLKSIHKSATNIHTSHKDSLHYDWKIYMAKILTNSSYCICISTKYENTLSAMLSNARKKSKISVFKFTQEKLISDCVIDEDICYFNYNPRNPLELIFCGKGYLRLWNVFINDGSLKEHPQRFFPGKQEKEHNFIKAEFFDNNSFMFIVGTKENNFYIIEGFTIIFELNATYSKESIYEMKIDKVLALSESNKHDEEDDIIEKKLLNDDTVSSDNKKEIYENEAVRTENSADTHSTYKIMHYMTDKKLDENIIVGNDKNSLSTFSLIQNSIILMTFKNESVTKVYVLEKDFKNQKKRKIPLLSNEDESKDSKFKKEESRVIRFANNIKSFQGMISNPDKSLFMFILELFPNEMKKTKHSLVKSKIDQAYYSVFLFKRNGKDLTFVEEIFKELFCSDSIKSFCINEKKKILYSFTNDNMLRCFDYNTYKFALKYQMRKNPLSITASPHNNLLGVCYETEFIIYAIFKKKVSIFCEFEIIQPFAKFSEKGDYIAVSGQSRVNKNFCVYFIDTLYFNTVHVIENLPQIKNLKFMNNDQFIFVMTEASSILGWCINFSLMTVNIANRLQESGKKMPHFYFEPFWSHSIKGNEYALYDYHAVDDILLVTMKNTPKKIGIITDKGKNLNNFFDLELAVTSIKIVKELNSVFIGTEGGSLRISKWPVLKKIDEKEILSVQYIYDINLHADSLNSMIFTKNFKSLFTSSSDGSIVISNLSFSTKEKSTEYDNYSLFTGNIQKPLIEEAVKLCEILEYKISDIANKDQEVIKLSKDIEAKHKTKKSQMNNVVKDYQIEVINLIAQKTDALNEEAEKEKNLSSEINNLQTNVEIEMENKIKEHEKEIDSIKLKYVSKIELYSLEINRLEEELKQLQVKIRVKFDNVQYEQLDFFNKIFDEYDQKYTNVKEKIEENLKTLLKTATENDAATDLIQRQYEEMKKDTNEKLFTMKRENEKALLSLKEECDSEKKKETDFKTVLQQKISETDKLIAQNSEIKKRLIETTQKTITFQEQLLETEKNLTKIDHKITDMDGKNKHLEQIRFVLEHRMTSLEKEKTPLENQCLNLESQKTKLQDEFNKLILDINLRNQKLEIKQSELKACLIQNFEINDHILYVKKKIEYLKSELNNFTKYYEDEDGNSKSLSLQENKITTIAGKLRKFYENCFMTNINEQLSNYRFYSSKLQEETEKMNMANNLDLIMRDKGEEKLIAEDKKMSEIQSMKASVFKRMQNENTVLISECNRLRKNLHEIYMHVVDIEDKFSELTKINPNLKKEEIVNQIKNFIEETHSKIKTNFKEEMHEEFVSNFQNNSNFILDDESNYNNRNGRNAINSLEKNNKNISNQKTYLGNMKLDLKNAVDENSFENENHYENFIILPEIKTGVISSKPKEEVSIKYSEHSEELPSIDYSENI